MGEDLELRELKEDIEKLNQLQVELIGNMSKKKFIVDYLELYEEYMADGGFLDFGKTRESEEVYSIYASLEDLYNKILSGQEDYRSEIEAKRERLYSLYSGLTNYYVELIYIQDMINDYIFKFREEEINLGFRMDLQKNIVLSELEEYLRKLPKDSLEYRYTVTTIVKLLPFKLSKYKFYDHVGNLLSYNLGDTSPVYVDYTLKKYSKFLSGSIKEDYGVSFDTYFVEVEKLRRRDFKNLSKEELELAYGDTNSLIRKIENYMDIIRRVGISINKLMVLNMVKNDLKISLESNDGIILSGRNKQLKDCKKAIKDYEKKLLDTVSDFQSYNRELYELDGDNEDFKELFRQSRNILMIYNDVDFLDYHILNLEDDSVIDPYDLELRLRAFIDYMSRVLDTYGYEGGGKHLRDLGAILGGNLPGQKARIKLMLLLSVTKDPERIRSAFEK